MPFDVMLLGAALSAGFRASWELARTRRLAGRGAGVAVASCRCFVGCSSP